MSYWVVFEAVLSILPCCSYDVPEPSDQEKVELEKQRTDKSKFVQELLLSTLTLDSSSSEDSASDT